MVTCWTFGNILKLNDISNMNACEMNEGRVRLLYLRLSQSKAFKCGHVLPFLRYGADAPQLLLDDKTIK